MSKIKPICIIALIPFLLFCTDNKKSGKTGTDIVSANSSDSVNIKIDYFNFTFSKEEFKLITDSFPQLKGKNGIIENPDSVYYKYPVYTNGYTFGSEAGQDQFYALYAYFLREKTGDKYEKERNNLIEIYRSLNEIYGEINRGGTYFGHMYARIIGYVEYEIYLYSLEPKNYKTTDFIQQKKKFIGNLQKMIDKSIIEYKQIDTALNKTDLDKNLKQLNNLLINEFYLLKAQNFKNKHYDF